MASMIDEVLIAIIGGFSEVVVVVVAGLMWCCFVLI